MSNQQQGTRGARPGNAEFPALRELMPGDALTPLNPSLINPIIRAYNALVRAEGRGKTADGKNTLRTTLAAGGFTIEIVPTPTTQNVIGEDVSQGGAGSGSSGVTYQGVWSSGGTYAQNDLVINTNGSQSGLFIRVSTSGGAGTEPFTGSYTSDWTMLARFFTTLLHVQNSATEYFTVNAAAKTAVLTNSNTSVTLDAGSSEKVRVNTTATAYAEMTSNWLHCQNNANTSKFEGYLVDATYGGPTFRVQQSNAAAEVTIGAIRLNSTATQLAELTADRIFIQNNANTVRYDFNTASQTANFIFSGGGSVSLENSACSNRALTIREIDVCENGVAKKMRCICSAPYT